MTTEDPSVHVLDQTHDLHRPSHDGDHGWTSRPTSTAVLKGRITGRHEWSSEDVARAHSPSMEYSRHGRGAPHRTGCLGSDYDPFRPGEMEERLTENRTGSTRPEPPPEYDNKTMSNEKFDHRAYSGGGRRNQDLQNGNTRIQLQRLGPPGDGSRRVLSSPVEGVIADIENSSRISTHAGRSDNIAHNLQSKNVSPVATPTNLAPHKETVGTERDGSDAGAAGGNHENGWFYCNAYNYLSGPFTLEILRQGFNVNFLPGELVVYYRQDGVYSAPQELKVLIDAPTISSQFVNSRPHELADQQVKAPRNLYFLTYLNAFLCAALRDSGDRFSMEVTGSDFSPLWS